MNRRPGSFNFNEKEVLLIDFIDTIIYIYMSLLILRNCYLILQNFQMENQILNFWKF